MDELARDVRLRNRCRFCSMLSHAALPESERFLTEATERRKIAWFQRRIAVACCRRSALTGDER